MDGKDLKSLVLDVTVMLELRPRLRWDWGVPAVCRSEGDFCGCWPATMSMIPESLMGNTSRKFRFIIIQSTK